MKPHLYIHQPSAIFKARVNQTEAITYPLTSLTYDNVTLGVYTDIQPDMTLLLGTTEGADDLGRVRVKTLADASSIPLPRTARGIEDGTLDYEDDAYITVLDDYRVWAKIPYFDTDNGVDYKDGNVEVGDFNTNIPPIANCGPGFADYLGEGDVITVDFDGSLSFPVADGATITDYNWDVKDGTITVGASTDAEITATFPAGFRWVALTVTDSNGKMHTARCPVLAVDPDDDVTVQGYRLNQRLEKERQTLQIELFPSLDRDTYLDGTLVLFWWDGASSPSDRSHIKFVGWLDTESEGVGRRKEGLYFSTNLQALDINGKLDKLPGFPQALYREEEDDEEENPALPWGYMPSLDMHKCLVYLLFWHSTALELGDFILPSTLQSYDTMRLDSGAGTLFQQVQQQAQKVVPDHYFTCNSKGQMIVKKDWMLEDVGDRPTTSPIITETNWNNLSFEYNRHPKIHVLRSGAIGVSTDWVDDGEGNDTLPLFFSIAPGDSAAFSQGTSEATENEGLTIDQTSLNKAEGHRYARLNSRFGTFSFNDPTGSDFWEYEPADFKRVQFNIGSAYSTKRGLSFTQMVGQVQSIEVGYKADEKGTSVSANVNFEKEVEGYPALSTYPDGDVDESEPIPPGTTPPTLGLISPYDTVAAIGSEGVIVRTTDFSSATPTWEDIDLDWGAEAADFFCSFVVDPFSPGYRGTPGGAINGWAAGFDGVWRIEDIFGTPTQTKVYSFEAGKLGDGDPKTIAASFGRYQEVETDNPWLMVVGVSNASGSTPNANDGMWCVYSLDAGVTWSDEIQISSFGMASDSDASLLTFPGVWLSPRTPGRALTFAYNTSTTTCLFESLDWGATWTAFDEPVDDPVEQLPAFRRWNGSSSSWVGSSYLSGMGSETFTRSSADGVASGYGGTMVFAPPADAVRVQALISYLHSFQKVSSPLLVAAIDLEDGAAIAHTPAWSYTHPSDPGGTVTGEVEIEFTKSSGATWPGSNRSNIDSIASPSGVTWPMGITVGTGGGASL